MSLSFPNWKGVCVNTYCFEMEQSSTILIISAVPWSVILSDDFSAKEHLCKVILFSIPASPIAPSSWITEHSSEPRQKVMSSPSGAAERPLHASSPVTDRKPKWTPPGMGEAAAIETYVCWLTLLAISPKSKQKINCSRKVPVFYMPFIKIFFGQIK